MTEAPVTETPYRIAMIPGDGIGKEVVPAAQRVLAALPLSFTFVPLPGRVGSV